MSIAMPDRVPAVSKTIRKMEEGRLYSERPYFASAIGVILTAGALWGVIILLRIALQGSFTSVSVHEVNAHGHAQIFGWVGLFVMGFGYRVLPLLAERPLPWPRVAAVSWLALLVGLTLRTVIQPVVVGSPSLLILASIGSFLGISAISLFVFQVGWLLRKPAGSLPSAAVWLVRAALIFFFLQALASAAYFHLTSTAASREELLWLISHFQPPLRDMQVHGFAMLMVLGMGVLMTPRWFGTPALNSRGSRIAAVALMIAVAAEIFGFLMMRLAGYRWASVWGVASLMLLASALYLVLKQRLLLKLPLQSRSSKFVRAAHGWLLLSLTMLVLLPAWQFGALPLLAPHCHAVEIGFSHAYYGSIRHAITVGFISLMILGMSVRLMERLHHPADLPRNTLLVAFCLVNLGCAMRVFFQLLTDIHPLAFPVAGISGTLELSGIGIWAVWMIRSFRTKGDPASDRELVSLAKARAHAPLSPFSEASE